MYLHILRHLGWDVYSILTAHHLNCWLSSSPCHQLVTSADNITMLVTNSSPGVCITPCQPIRGCIRRVLTNQRPDETVSVTICQWLSPSLSDICLPPLILTPDHWRATHTSCSDCHLVVTSTSSNTRHNIPDQKYTHIFTDQGIWNTTDFVHLSETFSTCDWYSRVKMKSW